jgi:hypothetical protein
MRMESPKVTMSVCPSGWVCHAGAVVAAAAIVALKLPVAGTALIGVCLILYLRPQPPGVQP